MKARIIGTTMHLVQGIQMDGHHVQKRPIIVRITSDEMGKSLSLSNEEDVMLMIPIEAIESRLKEVLK